MEIRNTLERRVPAALILLGIGFGTLSLEGCASPEVERGVPGTVVKHVDHPAYTTYVHAGKVLVPIYHPEKFGLEIEQCDREGDAGADSEGCVTAEATVDKQTYDQYPDGSQIVLPPEK